MQSALVLGLLVLAIVLFAREKLPADIITLLLLVALVGSSVLTTAEAFEGFSSDIIIILGSIFVISGALQETGLLDAIGERLVRLSQAGSKRLLLLLMGSAASISAFMNNTTVAAMLVPPVIGMARNAKTSPSRLLMPLAFASILGGTCTLIGTSTNVAVSGYIAKLRDRADRPRDRNRRDRLHGSDRSALSTRSQGGKPCCGLRLAGLLERNRGAAGFTADRADYCRMGAFSSGFPDIEPHSWRRKTCPGFAGADRAGRHATGRGPGRHPDEDEESRGDRDPR